VVLRADAAAVAASLARASAGAPASAPEIHGAEAVANTFKGRARAAQLALIDGDIGLVFAPEISLTADASSIAALDLKTML
jgi:RNA polymerase sigma-70 factor (ECF subfamily)